MSQTIPITTCTCPVCNKSIPSRGPASHACQCDNCNQWVHAKCLEMTKELYEWLKKQECNSVLLLCKSCRQNFVPKPLDGSTEKSHTENSTKYISEHVQNETTTRTTMSNITRIDKESMTPKVRLNDLELKNSIVIFNFPEENTAKDVHEKIKSETKTWHTVCDTMKIGTIIPLKMIRLNRKNEHSDDRPRIVRAYFRNQNEVEKILLASHLLKIHKSEIAIYPDLPYQIRQEIKNNKDDDKLKRKRNIIIRNIPELNSQDIDARIQHDAMEWEKIAQRLRLNNVLATKVIRLPRPRHLQSIKEPRLTRITLYSSEMVDILIKAYQSFKSFLPSQIIHRDLPRIERQTKNVKQNITNDAPRVELVSIIDSCNYNEDTTKKSSTVEVQTSETDTFEDCINFQ